MHQKLNQKQACALGTIFEVFLTDFAFQNGCLLGFMLLSLLPFQLDPMIVFAIGGVVGVGCSYIAIKKLRRVKTYGTAAFGAFLLAKGVGSFVGNFPALFNNVQNGELDDTELQKALEGDMNKKHIYYFVAMILLTFIGVSFVFFFFLFFFFSFFFFFPRLVWFARWLQ